MKVDKKPENVPFPHGIVIFSTNQGELYYQIQFWQTKKLMTLTQLLPVLDQEHLKQLQSITAREVQAQ